MQETLRAVPSQALHPAGGVGGVILMPGMVVARLTCWTQETADEVAIARVRWLARAVPAAVPVTAFLPGG